MSEEDPKNPRMADNDTPEFRGPGVRIVQAGATWVKNHPYLTTISAAALAAIGGAGKMLHDKAFADGRAFERNFGSVVSTPPDAPANKMPNTDTGTTPAPIDAGTPDSNIDNAGNQIQDRSNDRDAGPGIAIDGGSPLPIIAAVKIAANKQSTQNHPGQFDAGLSTQGHQTQVGQYDVARVRAAVQRDPSLRPKDDRLDPAQMTQAQVDARDPRPKVTTPKEKADIILHGLKFKIDENGACSVEAKDAGKLQELSDLRAQGVRMDSWISACRAR